MAGPPFRPVNISVGGNMPDEKEPFTPRTQAEGEAVGERPGAIMVLFCECPIRALHSLGAFFTAKGRAAIDGAGGHAAQLDFADHIAALVGDGRHIGATVGFG